MAGTSIADAFSGIRASTLAVILEDFSLAPDTPVADLLSLGVTGSDALNVIASYIISSTSRLRLDEIVPVLHRDSHLPLQLDAFTTRPANALQRSGVCTWQQLLGMTSTDLLRLPSVGTKSVTEIITVVLTRAAVQVLVSPDENEAWSSTAGIPAEGEKADVSISAPSSRSEPGISDGAALPGLQTVERWAACIGGAETIGAALELARSRVLPDDVAEAVDVLWRTPIQLNSAVKSHVAAAYDLLWEACGDERRQEIFRRRISFHAPTLDELGAEMMLTRERVRQLQRAAQDSVLRRPAPSRMRRDPLAGYPAPAATRNRNFLRQHCRACCTRQSLPRHEPRYHYGRSADAMACGPVQARRANRLAIR